MKALIEIITVIAEISSLIYYFYSILSHPAAKKSYVIASITLFACALTVLSVCSVSPLIRIAFSIVGTETVCLIIRKESWLKILYLTLIFYAMSIASDIFCSGVLALFGMPIELQMSSAVAERTLYIVTAKLLNLIGIQIAIAIFRRRGNDTLLIQTVPLIIGQVASIFICHQLYLSMKSGVSVMSVVDIVGMMYINIVICYYVESIKSLYENRKEKEIAERQLTIQQSYYEQVLANQEETRSLWHDIKKYLGAMNAMASKMKEENVTACLQQAQEAFSKIDNVVDVGNPIVNGVLEYGRNRAEKTGVILKLDVWVPKSISISPIDLYVIIGNTLDNAIEECSTLEKDNDKMIFITLKQKNHMLYYEIKNPCSGCRRPKHIDGDIHGYGLKNVQRCVEKYNGTFSHETVDGMFIASAQINI